MKKLLFILSAILVSVITYGASLNPYAYNLSSTWNEETQELTVRFTLNAHPNMQKNPDGTTNPDGGQNSGQGIQIFAVDPDTKEQYYIYGIPGSYINERKLAGSYDYEYTIPIDGMSKDADVSKRRPLPAGKNLTWGVVVQGKNRTDQSKPVVVNDNIANRPYSCHGIAVNNNQNSADFGSIYVTEASNGVADNNTWKWLVGKGKSLLKYTPRLEYSTSYQKASPFSNRDKAACLLEPHRVRISDDGRIFVSSYNRNTRDDQIAVWELKNGVYTPVIYHNTYNGMEGVYGDRVCGMDVKGSGRDLRILLCFFDEYDGTYANAFRIYEYDLNNLGAKNNEGSWKCSYRPDGNTYDFSGNKVVSAQSAVDAARRFKWYFYSDGFANVAYGKKNKNDIFLSIDYCQGVTYNASIVYFKDAATSPTSIQNVNSTNHYYGGGGFVPIVEGNNEYIVSSRTKEGGSGTFPESNGYIHTYPINGTTISTSPRAEYTLSNIKSETAINDMAMDCANNLYAVSFTDGSKGSGRLIAIAMPYDGKTTTIAPTTNANENKYFNIKPVPNILATDLTYAPYGNENKYEFSFNVNTKPEEAQIRFYSSYDAMKNSLNVVNADNYDGTNANKPVYVYNIPDDQLKQGRIAVKLGAVGGQADANGVINNDRLPAGVLYWSVYVKTRKSNAFAPTCRLEGINDAQGAHRRYATVNNYPETDMFGSFIVADCPTVNSVNGPYNGLMIYGINPDGNSNDEQSDISNGVRYSHRESYLNSGVESDADKLNFPRRLVVAPDGRVFIADQGTTDAADYAGATTVVQHVRGGVRIWDPADPKKFTLFSHNKIGTSFGVSLWEHPAANGGLKIYASNAYEEYLKHNTTNNYTDQQKDGIFGWNGLAEYTLSAHPNGSENWSKPDSVHYALGRGDASGNYSLVAMDKGIWMCQHREHNRQLKDEALQPLADNLDAVLLSFFPYGSTKVETWNSCTTNGVNNYDDATNRAERADASDLTQKKTSPIQSTPGAGMAYRKIDGKEYLFVVNHDGNIAQILIDGWTGSGATATPTIDASKVKILVTPAYTKGDRDVDNASTKWHTAFITTINFDYAGNLVTTTGKSFGEAHDIIVYTMPYDRVNAREIQAPNSCRMIPERIAQLDMNKEDLDELIEEHQRDHLTGCAIDLYRPLQGGMFNTICLPCTLDLKTLPKGHPLYEAELKEYTGLNLNTVGGEKVLELVFTNVSDKVIIANEPYIIEPKDDYNSIIRFAGPLRLTNTTGEAVYHEENSKNYNITYQGIIPFQNVEPKKDLNTGEILTLMLVADNRLAAMTVAGPMYGFRGYFELNQPLPKGMQTRITTSKGTTTNTTIVVDGKKVNVEKFLQEGRVYIRMGDSLYTLDGQKVK